MLKLIKNMFSQKSDVTRVTIKIKNAIEKRISKETNEKFWVTHYGANDIHPKHLVCWVCVISDKEKMRLEADKKLYHELRNLLSFHNYPIEGREGVHIGFESQETVDRESDGNWWHHWK